MTVIDAGGPILPEIPNNTVIFRYYVLSWNQLDSVVCGIAVDISSQVAKFNERVPPVVGIKCIFHKLAKPLCVKEGRSLLFFLTFLIYNFERTGHDKSLSLLDTA